MQFILSLGTNLPNRVQHLSAARAAIDDLCSCRVVASSCIYETEPVDVVPEHMDKPFLNAALLVETTLSPVDFSSQWRNY